MAILNILEYPDPRLRTKAVPVTKVDDNIKRIVDDMFETMQEGCLSIPGFYEDVSRIDHCLVKALDRDGNPFELECTGLLAVCIQHEIDHLEGILYVDHISALKRNRIKEKLQKKHKLEARQGRK